MKGFLLIFVFFLSLALMPVLANAQADQYAVAAPPISQPLVREGALATDLAGSLRIGNTSNEAEAESALTAVGISPRNGWIADYPVTPDIVGELRLAISNAAVSNMLPMGKDEALRVYDDVIKGSNLPVRSDTYGQTAERRSGTGIVDETVVDNYYDDEDPPVVTYYPPPPDYEDMYTWVPYPFMWSDFWFPGFFVLIDFDVRVHRHGHKHGHDELVSNHFRDGRTGRLIRIDPANRAHGGTVIAGGVQSAPTVRAHTGNACTSCHSTPPAGGRSSSPSGGSRGFSGGSLGGVWRR